MLEAAHNNKIRTSRLCENEIASTIFGPLQYFQGNLVYQFFCNLWESSSIYLGNRLLKVRNEDAKSSVKGVYRPPQLNGEIKCDFQFWPSLKNGKEPDLVVDIKNGGNLIWSFLIEVKWNAGLNPPDQLEMQYNGWLKEASHDEKKLSHVFVALHLGRALREIIEHPKPVAIISWVQLQRVLSNSGFKQPFSESVRLFLRHLGAREFNGFSPQPSLESNFWKPDFIRKFFFNEITQGITLEESCFFFGEYE